MTQQREGFHTGRPPLFNGTNYAYWKKRMIIFIQSYDVKLWVFFQIPYTQNKEFELMNDDELAMVQMNAKLMNILMCGLTEEEYGRINACDSAYEAWHMLESHFEGRSSVKETRIDSFMQKYEMFAMKPNESISEMHTRFTHITNSLKNLGKVLIESDRVRKFLRSLTLDWEKKTTAIEEAKDLSKLKMEDLIGSLMAYEIQMEERREKEKEREGLRRKEKTIALKATSDLESIEDDDTDDDVAFLTRNFKKFLAKGRFTRGKGESSRTFTCYECNKTGHMKKDCPLLKPRDRDQREPRRFSLRRERDERPRRIRAKKRGLGEENVMITKEGITMTKMERRLLKPLGMSQAHPPPPAPNTLKRKKHICALWHKMRIRIQAPLHPQREEINPKWWKLTTMRYQFKKPLLMMIY